MKQIILLVVLLVSFPIWPQTCTNSTNHTSNDGGGDTSVIQSNPCTTGANGAGYINPVLHVYLTTASGNIQLGLYTDKTSGCFASIAHCPSTKVCTTSSVAAVSGQNDLTPSGCGTLIANTQYWVAYEIDNGTGAMGTDGTTNGGPFDTATTYGTFPASYPNSANDGPNGQLWFTATAASGGNPAQFPRIE